MNTIQEKINALKTGIQSVQNSVPKNIKLPRYTKKGGHGGKRQGTGRKPSKPDEVRRTIKKAYEEFAEDEVEVQELHKGTKEIRVKKLKRIRVIQEALFKKAKDGDVSAIKEFNDRVMGKSKQPITGGEEDDTPLRIEHSGIDRILDNAYGDDEE